MQYSTHYNSSPLAPIIIINHPSHTNNSVWNEIVTSCVELASFNARDTIRQLEYAGVTYVQGYAAFADSGGSSSLFVTDSDNFITTLNADKILIATGSTPFRPGGVPFDGKRIFDSDSINSLSYLPKSVAITGSGIIAIEFAKIFKNLGSDVTLIIRDNIPRNALMKIGLDKDISATLVADLVSLYYQARAVYLYCFIEGVYTAHIMITIFYIK